jgi:hypothetical protein
MKNAYHYRGWVIQRAEVHWAATKDGCKWRFGVTLEKVKQNIDEQEFLLHMARQLLPNAIRRKRA